MIARNCDSLAQSLDASPLLAGSKHNSNCCQGFRLSSLREPSGRGGGGQGVLLGVRRPAAVDRPLLDGSSATACSCNLRWIFPTAAVSSQGGAMQVAEIQAQLPDGARPRAVSHDLTVAVASSTGIAAVNHGRRTPAGGCGRRRRELLLLCWHPLFVPIETPARGGGGCSRKTISRDRLWWRSAANFADALSPSMLIQLLKVEGGAAE